MKRLTPLLFATAASCALPAAAQIVVPPSADPGALQQRRIDEEQRQREEERLQRRPVTEPLEKTPAAPAAPRLPDAAVRFVVKEIRFTPSAIFTAAELRTMVSNFEHKQLSLPDLQVLIDYINNEYRRRGIATAQAVLPPQDVTSGVIQIRLVEGRIGGVSINGNASTREDYILDRLHLPLGKLVDLKTFEEDLKYFNRTNDIQLRAALKPGDYASASEVVIDVAEPQRQTARVTIDNLGSKSTGQWRAGLAYTNRSLFGYRDDLNLSGTFADGLKSYSLSYGFPVNTRGGRVTLAAYQDATDIKHGSLVPLAITGDSTTYQLTFRQPVIEGENMQLDLSVGAKHRDTRTKSSGVTLQDSSNEDVTVGGDLALYDSRGYWGMGLNGSIGSTHSRVTALDDTYAILRGSLRRTQRIAEGWTARGSLSFQRSPDNQLPSGEQFVIGGDGTVRGLPLAAYAGNQGQVVNLELHHPLANVGAANSMNHVAATGMFFADYGHASPYRPPGSILNSYDNAASAGWGINYAIGPRLSGRLVYAYVISGLPSDAGRHNLMFQLVAQVY